MRSAYVHNLTAAHHGFRLSLCSAQVHVEAFDYHWVNYSRENLTWGSSLGTQELPGTGKLSIPLQEIIQQRVISNDYQLPDFPAGFVDLELKWLPILE